MQTPNPSTIELPTLEDPDAWEAPILFDEINTPEIPARLLPGVLGDFASALSIATETPEALTVMTLLGVISACVSKRFVVSPKEGWQEPINIYTLVALPPANNKSLVLNCCTHPLVEWEKQAAIIMEPEIKRQRSERKTQEKIIEGLRAKASKVASSSEQQSLIKEITEKENKLIEPQLAPAIFANDATPEALATLTHEQGGRFAVFSDEGGIMETLAGLYNQGNANIDILLKGIDGGAVRVRRKDRSININPYLTIVLTVQPAVIQRMGEKRAYSGNGALERFLYALPNSKLGFRTHNNPPVAIPIKKQYEEKIKDLIDIPPQMINRQQVPFILTLSEEAFKSWRKFQAQVELDLRPDGRLINCQGWGGKISGFALRIAGLLHVIENQFFHLIIKEHTMNNALEIASLLIEHAIAAYGMMKIDEATHDAKELFLWIKQKSTLSFTKSEITSAMRNKKMAKKERLSKAIDLLIERNIISPPSKLPTRKPTTIFRVNPEVIVKIT